MKKIIPVLAVAISALSACNSGNKQTVTDSTIKTKTQVISIDSTKLNQRWVGKWERLLHGAGADISITKLNGSVFKFWMEALSGGHTGELEGKLHVDGNKAAFISDEDKTCKLNLKMLGDSVITVDDNNSCAQFGGMGVDFSGRFVSSKRLTKAQQNGTNETMVSIQALTPGQDSVLRALVDDKTYTKFVGTTQQTTDGAADLDGLNAKVMPSGVRGLFTIMEDIIMVDSAKHMWAALLDNDKVYYYTNQPEYKTKLPKTIEDWRSRFNDIPVIYKSK